MPPGSASHPGTRASRARRRLLAFALGLLLAAGVVELSLRILVPQPKSWLEVFRELPAPLNFGLIPDIECQVDTGDSAWSVRTDSDGRRIGAHDTRPAGSSVAVIGDSFVFGHGIDFEQSIVGLLGSAAGDGTTFRNEGVPAYGPIQYRTLLQRDLRAPEGARAIVVVSYLGNDFFDCIWDKRPILHNGTLGDTGGLRSFLKRNLHLYRLGSRLWHAAGPRSKADELLPMFRPEDWSAQGLTHAREVYESEFRIMRDDCQAAAVPLLAVLLPPVEQIKHAGEAPGALQYDLPTRMAAKILQELGVAAVDPSAKLAEAGFEACYLRVDGHFSRRGNEIVQAEILAALRALPGWQR